MIPKVIHYCWFGNNEKTPLIKACIESWGKYLPDWKVIEWNEENSPIDHPFVKKALRQKKYAFAADYVRCYVLYNEGGVYLDTDMEIIKDISSLLKYDFFSAYEDEDITKISCGAIGCIKNHKVMQDMLDFYHKNPNIYIAMPQILGKVYIPHTSKKSLILPAESFYPYNPFNEKKYIKQLMFKDILDYTYGIHHWNYSWEFNLYERILNKFNKFLNSLLRTKNENK